MSGESFLAILPWDVERWFQSDSFLGLSLAEQGAYRNLCDRAWQRQPFCALPDDDAILWKLAGAQGREEWQGIRDRVFSAGGWSLGASGWTHPTVIEMYQGAVERHARAVKAGRIAGKASGRVRRELSKHKRDGTIVQRSSTARANDRSTIVNPPSPSPSPSPSPENGTDCGAAAPPLPATIPKPGPPSWSREACDDWIGRYGGTAPGGKIGRALKPVVDRHGWPAVRPAWRSYLEQTEAEYASPPRFAETYGRWSGSAPQARASPARATVGEKSMAAAARFLARRSDGGEREEGGTGGAVPPGAVEAQRKLPAGGG